MKKLLSSFLVVIIITMITIPAFAVYYPDNLTGFNYNNGYFDNKVLGVDYFVSSTNSVDLSNILDNNTTTSVSELSSGKITITFTTPINISHLYINNSISVGFEFFNSSGAFITRLNGAAGYHGYFNFDGTVINDIKKITFGGYYDSNSIIKEFEVFKVPVSLSNPVIASTVNSKSINLSWNPILDAVSYNIYKNGILVENVANSVAEYDFTGLIPDTSYTFKVEAVGDGIDYKTSSSTVALTTKPYFSSAPSGIGNPAMTNALITWTAVDDTKYYEIKLGETGEIHQTTDFKYLFEGLEMLTNYSVYIRQVNLADVYSSWNKIDFTTTGPPEIPPDKPDSVTLISKGLDFIEVEVSEVLWADEYLFYLNNVLITTQPGRVYRFTGLNSNTAYGISVKSSNEYGDSRFGTYLGVRTDTPPIPTVTGATVKPVSGGSGTDLTKQNLTWQSSNVTGGYKIIIDGEEVATVGSDVNSYSIDFASLGLTGDKHSVEVVPLDADGKSFKLENVYTKSVGNSDLDGVVFSLLSGLDIIKKGGIYLLLAIISVLILFLVVLFIFNKMKLNLATNDDNSLESNPDEQIATIDKKNKFDKDTYYVAKTLESKHKTEKNEDFNFKSFLNDIFNGGSYKGKSYGGKSYRGKSRRNSYINDSYGHKYINTKDGKGRYSGISLESNYDKHNPYNSRFDELKKRYDKTK